MDSVEKPSFEDWKFEQNVLIEVKVKINGVEVYLDDFWSLDQLEGKLGFVERELDESLKELYKEEVEAESQA